MAKICNYGMCIPKELISSDVIAKIKSELTVIPEKTFGLPVCYSVYRESKRYFIIPIYYGISKNLGLEYSIVFPEINKIKVKDIIKLKNNQIECFNRCIKEFDNEYGGGIIGASTGFGKTILAIKLIAYAKMKTLILVNKIELMTQWKEQINKWLPECSVGIIRRDKFIVDCDIVIGTVQTICSRDSLTTKDFSWVSMCIIDEIHGIASQVFSNIFFKIRPRYSFGLSATIERKDKCEKVIHWCIGNTIYSDNDANLKQSSDIQVYHYKGKSSMEIYIKNGDLNISRMISNISEDYQRNVGILRILNELVEDNSRKILVISERIAQLKFFHKELGEISGLYIGATSNEERENIKKNKSIILGTYSIVSEGFNHPCLNTLVFSTPRSNIKQSIGRIYRKKHSIKPVIVDIYDGFSLFCHQFSKRKMIYNEEISNVSFNYCDLLCDL